MILIIDNKDLNYEFNFNAKEGDTLQDLIDEFIALNGEALFNSATLIIVRAGDFGFIIKNIYGNLKGGLLISNIGPFIQNHLDT